MPRFYFDTENGQAVPDADGTELTDLRAAKHEAYKVLCQLIPLHQDRLMGGETFTLRLCDEDRLLLLTVEVVSTLAPALSPPRP